MIITRTVEVNDLTPVELANLFTAMDGDQQAQFFAAIWDIAKDLPGAGWCQQSLAIAQASLRHSGAINAVQTLAAHFMPETEA